MMRIEWIVALMLAVAVLGASARLLLWQRAAGEAGSSRPMRIALLLLLQPVCALLLFLTLFPPVTPAAGGALRIATTGTARGAAAASGPPLIALPEAGLDGIDSAPDLATALREHPGTGRIHILGAGLTPRDVDAARGMAVDFTPPPLAPGIRSLTPPPITAAGAPFRVAGQLARLPGAGVELIDPAGRVTDRVTTGRDGRFALTGTARTAGGTAFALRVREGRRLIEEATVPLLVQDMTAPRLLIVAAAPGAEVKYLRRWASDAGFDVTTQMQAGGGIMLGDAPVAMDGASLRRFDIAIFDDRSWAALGAGRGAVMGAVREGMGLLLRPGGAMDVATRSQWQALGFTLSGRNEVAPLALPPIASPEMARTRMGIGSDDAPVDIATPDDALPDVGRLSATPGGPDAVAMLHDASGATIGAWRAVGLGRVGLFTGIDSYGLTLTGRRDLYEQWWSDMLSTLARPGAAQGGMEAAGWVKERVILCGIGKGAHAVAPDGRSTALLPEGSCGAYWPASAGWHRLEDGGKRRDFYIYPADALPVMRAARNADATMMLAGGGEAPARAPGPGTPASPWPFALGWLLASALLWWLERAGHGRTAPVPVSGDQSAM